MHDSGITYFPPKISRLSDNRTVAIFGNGFTDTGDTAALYVIDFFIGELVKTISVGITYDDVDAQTTGLGVVTLV